MAKINGLTELLRDYPKSNYVDDALFERGRSYVKIEKPNNALEDFYSILDRFPNSSYYSKSLYFDELYVAKRISDIGNPPKVDKDRIENWVSRYCDSKSISLSKEQADAAKEIVCQKFSILTGGPGCGKTTATLVIVKLIEAMGLKVLLAAPTALLRSNIDSWNSSQDRRIL